jgi:hypothetical protein
MRYNSIPLIIGVILLLCVSSVSSCGFTTHNVVAERAANYYFHTHYDAYKQIANKYRDSVLGVIILLLFVCHWVCILIPRVVGRTIPGLFIYMW